MDTTDKRKWLVFYTKPRAEKKAEAELKSIQIEVYLPLQKVIRKWSDRKKTIEEPLFKSYIFARVNEKERLMCLVANSIVRNVSFSGKIAVVPDWQIESIKKSLEKRNEDILLSTTFKKGDRVRIIAGPLEGIQGVIEYSNEGNYLQIHIESIGKVMKIKLSADDVIKIEN